MYRKPKSQFTLDDFRLPFEGNLSADNRWVKLAGIIPWDEIETRYASLFPSNTGNVAKPARMAVGSLIIKERCNFTDEETVEQIKENPYLQYFIGLKEFQTEAPFDPSLMTYFRKRLGPDIINEINELICQEQNKDDDPPSSGDDDIPKKGNLLLDATCAPADIRYPTDISLLNEAREKTEQIIDTLYKDMESDVKKPRTYRVKARKNYLAISKQRKPSKKKIRKAIKKQLGYLNRNLKNITLLLLATKNNPLSRKQQEELEVIRELYHQQKYMYDHQVNKIENRIVSISQPHINPIVRGKANAATEFGAKIGASMVNGFVFLDILRWDNFNEGTTLIESVETYKKRYGYYPEAVIVDDIYRTRGNINYCKEKGIRISGSKLGRKNQDILATEKKQGKKDAKERNAIEGKFGEGKRRYGLEKIMARLRETSETEIALQFLVMNLEHCLHIHFNLFLRDIFSLFKERYVSPNNKFLVLTS